MPLDEYALLRQPIAMGETWPDPSIAYDYPARTPANDRRWQDGIAAGLSSGDLTVTPRTAGGDQYELAGSCPRCSHTLSQTIEFDVLLGVRADPVRRGRFNIECNCRSQHTGRDDEHLGCGWGGSIPVALNVRES